MDSFFLKNGLEAKIDIWDYHQLKEFTKQDLPTYKQNRELIFEGFSFLRPYLTYQMEKEWKDTVYTIGDHLSKFEIQDQQLLDKLAYTRSITASVDDTLIGILLCQWGKWHEDFWHYHIRFIDVHKDFRNQGVATELLKQFNDTEFLKGKILFMGLLTKDGHDYLKHVIEKELKAEDYAIIFRDYSKPKIPDKSGIYNGEKWIY